MNTAAKRNVPSALLKKKMVQRDSKSDPQQLKQRRGNQVTAAAARTATTPRGRASSSPRSSSRSRVSSSSAGTPPHGGSGSGSVSVSARSTATSGSASSVSSRKSTNNIRCHRSGNLKIPPAKYLPSRGGGRSRSVSASSSVGVQKKVIKRMHIRLMLLHIEPSDELNRMKKMAKDLRLKLTDSPLEANYVVVGEIKRTARFMSVLCVTDNILKKTWLVKSYEQRRPLQPFVAASGKVNGKEPYLLTDDVDAEKKFQFSMRETLESGRERRKTGGLLAGWDIFVCDGVAGNKAPKEVELRTMVQAAGGRWLAKMEERKNLEKEETGQTEEGKVDVKENNGTHFVEDAVRVIVVTSDPPTPIQMSDGIVSGLLKDGASCFTTTWLIDCMMHQELVGIKNLTPTNESLESIATTTTTSSKSPPTTPPKMEATSSPVVESIIPIAPQESAPPVKTDSASLLMTEMEPSASSVEETLSSPSQPEIGPSMSSAEESSPSLSSSPPRTGSSTSSVDESSPPLLSSPSQPEMRPSTPLVEEPSPPSPKTGSSTSSVDESSTSVSSSPPEMRPSTPSVEESSSSSAAIEDQNKHHDLPPALSQLIDYLQTQSSGRIDAKNIQLLLQSMIIQEDGLQSFLDYESLSAKSDENSSSNTSFLTELLRKEPPFELINYLFKEGIIDGIRDINEDLFQKYLNLRCTLLKHEVEVAAQTATAIPFRRGRINVVGQCRGGKTNLINALMGKKFNNHFESTPGINIIDAKINLLEDAKKNLSGDVLFTAGHPWEDCDPLNRCKEKIRALQSILLEEGALSEYSIGERRGSKKDQLQFNKSLEEKESSESPSSHLLEATSNAECETILVDKDEDNIRATNSGNDLNFTSSNLKLLRGFPLSKDEAEQNKDFTMFDQRGRKLYLRLCDFGGSDIFRIIQNSFMHRNCSYAVVFNILDLLDDAKRDQALESLQYWLGAIETYAKITEEDKEILRQNTNEGAEREKQSLFIEYPPVIFIGTHLDEIQRKYSKYHKVMNEIRKAHEILLEKFGAFNSFQTSLHNKMQNLCFWPVSNSNPEDKNIIALRSHLIRVTVEDTTDYVNNPIPISWLEAIDALTELGEYRELVGLFRPIDSETNGYVDSDEENLPSTVLEALKNCNVLQGINRNDTATTNKILGRFLNFCNSICAFVYFGSVPGLQGCCITQPQWLTNTISYLVRDHQKHTFTRDYEAMDLNGGALWTKYLDTCVLEEALLHKLWLGEQEHWNFLINFMIKLHIIAPLFTTEQARNRQFLVPSLMGLPASDPGYKNYKRELDRYLEQDYSESKIEFKSGFLASGLYQRLVARLIKNVWISKGSSELRIPEILNSGSLIHMGSDYKLGLMPTDMKTGVIKVFTRRESSKFILPHVAKAVRDINSEFYYDRLEIDLTELEHV